MRVAVHEKSNIAVVPFTPSAASLIPHARSIERGGHKFLLVPAKKEELQLLRNLGYETPRTVDINYNWSNQEPFETQVETTNMLIHSPRAFVLSEMGTGKTMSALFAYDYLKQHGLARKMLVVSPLSTLVSVWAKEVFARFPHLTTSVVHGTARRRQMALEDDADIYIINHHGVKTVQDLLKQRTDIDVVVIDELAVLRNHRTDLWKAANKVCDGKKFVWGMTGSPTPREPCDAWAQIKLINPSRTTKYFKQFKDATMTQFGQFRWVAKSNANETVYGAMQPSVRFTRDDCIDLPPTTYTTLDVELSKDQAKIYKQFMKDLYMAFQQGEVTAVNEAVKIGKLLQICCGFAYTSDQVVVDIPHAPRIQAVKDIIDQAAAKVIIFVPFVQTVKSLSAELAKDPTLDVYTIYGGTAKGERDRIFNIFSNTEGKQVLIAHPQCMAHGVTLTSANTIVWYSSPMSLELYEPANARITRPGQKLNTHIIQLQSTKLEKKFYAKLDARGKTQGALLKMFEDNESLI